MRTTLFVIFASILLNACSDNSLDMAYNLDELAKANVATVQGRGITLGEVDQIVAFHNSNPSSVSFADKKNILDKLIQDEVLYQTAVSQGFLENPQLKNNIRQLVAHEYEKYLKSRAGELVKVTETEVRLHYEADIEKYTKSAMFRLAIYERRDDTDKNHTYTLDQIIASASYLEPADGFGEYAFDSSHLNTRNRGGKLSWVTGNTKISGIPGEVIDIGASLQVGEVSKAISISGRKYLVRKVDEKASSVIPFESVKSDLTRELVKKEKSDLYDAKLESIKSGLEIDVDESLLKRGPKSEKSGQSPLTPPGFPVK